MSDEVELVEPGSEPIKADFGKVYIDLDKNDPSKVFKDLPDAFFMVHKNPEKCCLYLCQLNNLMVEHSSEYPPKISQINPFTDLIYVIIRLTNEFPDENVVDLQSLFLFWLDFLNENADWIDKIKNDPWEEVGIYFFNILKKIIENDEQNNEGQES